MHKRLQSKVAAIGDFSGKQLDFAWSPRLGGRLAPLDMGQHGASWGKSRREAVWGKANTRDKQTLVPSRHILIFSEFNCSKCQCFEKSYFCSSGRCLSTSGKRQVFNVSVGLLLSVKFHKFWEWAPPLHGPTQPAHSLSWKRIVVAKKFQRWLFARSPSQQSDSASSASWDSIRVQRETSTYYLLYPVNPPSHLVRGPPFHPTWSCWTFAVFPGVLAHECCSFLSYS